MLLLVCAAFAPTANGQVLPAREAKKDSSAVPARLRPASEQHAKGTTPALLPDSLLALGDSLAFRLWAAPPLDTASAAPVPAARALVFKESYRLRTVTPAPQAADTASARVGVSPDPADTDPASAFSKLQRKGTISRAVSAGNRRDVAVESGMRMEVSGELVDGVSINAVLTDENTPILPEGTTQRVSEFDRVAIQLQAKHGSLELGDVELALRGTEFARFDRKLQGAASTVKLPSSRGGFFAGGSGILAAAAARGQFRLQEISPIDGVQAPYRLEGGAGEPFILVVAGSDVVYIDGQRMERGEEADYVIDYQTGEVTFTARRMVTDDRRIVVEFQYTTFEYTRTLTAASAETGWWRRADGTSRLRFGATFLREADSRQFNAELGLSGADSLLIAQAGDGLAFRSGAEPLTGPYDPESPFVQYVKEVREENGVTDTIFVPVQSAPLTGTQLYRVRFTRMGEGKGSYTRTSGVANGLAYDYVGKGRGEYEPIRMLPRPREHRIVDFAAAVQPVRGVELFGEWAGSLLDLNRISYADAADDLGRAYLAGLKVEPQRIPRLGRLSGGYSVRSTGENFRAFDRSRPVEFARLWNISARPGAGSVLETTDAERISQANLDLRFSPTSSLSAEWGEAALGSYFDGRRQGAALTLAEPGLPGVSYRIEHVRSADAVLAEEGTWLRQIGRLSHALAGTRLTPAFEVEQERRLQYELDTDSLARTSRGFLAVRPGVTWADEAFEAGGSVEVRREQDWQEGVLGDAGTELTVQSQLRYSPGQTLSTQTSIGVRSSRFKEYFRVHRQRQNAESLVLMWNGRAAPLARAVEAQWHYEALTERTPVMQEMYLRARPEQGEYVWEDANGDGAIQVDEFLPERTPNEGLYVKTFFPSDELVSVIGVQGRLRLALDPAKLWKGRQTGWRGVASKVSARTTLEVVEKSRDPDVAQIYLLNLRRFLSAANTMTGRMRVAQEISLFRGQPQYGADFGFNLSKGLTELASGEETRLIRSWTAAGRWRPVEGVETRLKGSLDRNRMDSEQYGSRRYDIRSVGVHPDVVFGTPRTMQVTAGLALALKEDAVGDRSVRLLRIPVEARYAKLKRLQLTSRAEFAYVDLNAEAAAGMALYELTEGRGAGTSMLWNVEAQYALNDYLRATLSYDGRSPSGVPALHMFRMQLSASF